MITIQNLGLCLSGIPVVKNLCADVQKGDFITIVGSNGSGKSSLFQMLSGRITPTAGSIKIEGEDLLRIPEQRKALLISHLQQNPSLNGVPSMTVEENFALALSKGRTARLCHAKKNMNKAAMCQALAPVCKNPEKLLFVPMRRLSGGQRQMAALAMATILPPQIMLLDEPTAALDPQAATRILLFASHLAKQHNITTLLVTHDPGIAIHLGNRLWVMRQGMLCEQYGPEKKRLSSEHFLGSIDYSKFSGTKHG